MFVLPVTRPGTFLPPDVPPWNFRLGHATSGVPLQAFHTGQGLAEERKQKQGRSGNRPCRSE